MAVQDQAPASIQSNGRIFACKNIWGEEITIVGYSSRYEPESSSPIMQVRKTSSAEPSDPLMTRKVSQGIKSDIGTPTTGFPASKQVSSTYAYTGTHNNCALAIPHRHDENGKIKASRSTVLWMLKEQYPSIGEKERKGRILEFERTGDICCLTEGTETDQEVVTETPDAFKDKLDSTVNVDGNSASTEEGDWTLGDEDGSTLQQDDDSDWFVVSDEDD